MSAAPPGGGDDVPASAASVGAVTGAVAGGSAEPSVLAPPRSPTEAAAALVAGGSSAPPAAAAALVAGGSSAPEPRTVERRERDAVSALFGLLRPVSVLEDYSCAYVSQILLHGRLYVAPDVVLFSSSIFGYKRRLIMPLSRVTRVARVRLVLVPALELTVAAPGLAGGQKVARFTSFFGSGRNDAHDLVLALHRHARPDLYAGVAPADDGALSAEDIRRGALERRALRELGSALGGVLGGNGGGGAGGPPARAAASGEGDGGGGGGGGGGAVSAAGVVGFAVVAAPPAASAPAVDVAHDGWMRSADGTLYAQTADAPADACEDAVDARGARRGAAWGGELSPLAAAVLRRSLSHDSSLDAAGGGDAAADDAPPRPPVSAEGGRPSRGGPGLPAGGAGGGGATSASTSGGGVGAGAGIRRRHTLGDASEYLPVYTPFTSPTADALAPPAPPGPAAAAAALASTPAAARAPAPRARARAPPPGPPPRPPPGPPPPDLFERLSRSRLVLDVALPSLSVAAFTAAFLADDAAYSIAAFHAAHGDRDVECCRWAPADDGGGDGGFDDADAGAGGGGGGRGGGGGGGGGGGALTRVIRLTMPLSGGGLLPVETAVEKVQRLAECTERRSGGALAVLESSATSFDVPFGSYFVTEETIVVASSDPAGAVSTAPAGGVDGGGCRLLAYVHVNFSKATVFRSRIEAETEKRCGEFLRSWAAELVERAPAAAAAAVAAAAAAAAAAADAEAASAGDAEAGEGAVAGGGSPAQSARPALLATAAWADSPPSVDADARGGGTGGELDAAGAPRRRRGAPAAVVEPPPPAEPGARPEGPAGARGRADAAALGVGSPPPPPPPPPTPEALARSSPAAVLAAYAQLYDATHSPAAVAAQRAAERAPSTASTARSQRGAPRPGPRGDHARGSPLELWVAVALAALVGFAVGSTVVGGLALALVERLARADAAVARGPLSRAPRRSREPAGGGGWLDEPEL